eukprot:65890_1
MDNSTSPTNTDHDTQPLLQNESNPEIMNAVHGAKFKNYTIGGICSLICITTWVAMSESVSSLFVNYKQLYFLRYCIQSAYAIMFVVWIVLRRCKCSIQITRDMIWSSFIMAVLGYLFGYFWYLSLQGTVPSINSIIYQSSVCISYIFSVLWLPNYSMTMTKNCSLLLCMIGVTLVSLGAPDANDNNQQNTWHGILECAVSAIMYGMYQVVVAIYARKYFSPHEDTLGKITSKLFMQGMIGLLTILTLWPGILILNAANIEPFKVPNKSDLTDMALLCVMDTVYSGAIMVGISATNPVFMAITQLFVIPLTLSYDVLINGLTMTFLSVLGGIFIVGSFIVMERK